MNGLRMSLRDRISPPCATGLVDQVNQQRALDHHDLEIEIVVARRVRIALPYRGRCRPRARRRYTCSTAATGLRNSGSRGETLRYISVTSAPVRMCCSDHRLKRRVHDVIAAGQNHVLLLANGADSRNSLRSASTTPEYSPPLSLVRKGGRMNRPLLRVCRSHSLPEPR